jgi:hypothetical protein
VFIKNKSGNSKPGGADKNLPANKLEKLKAFMDGLEEK